MTRQEWQQCVAFMQHQNRLKYQRPTIKGKHAVKAGGKGVGVIMKKSWIRPQVGVERFFR